MVSSLVGVDEPWLLGLVEERFPSGDLVIPPSPVGDPSLCLVALVGVDFALSSWTFEEVFPPFFDVPFAILP
jgi:hypothetical protein